MRIQTKNIGDSFYLFDQKQIFNEISKKSELTFTIINEFPIDSEYNLENAKQWHIEQYDYLAEEILNSTWKNNDYQWKLKIIISNWDCDEEVYLKDVTYYYYSYVKENLFLWKEFETEIQIRGTSDFAMVTKYENTYFLGEKEDVLTNNVSAAEAIGIAEKAGGEEFRESYNNSCAITAFINGNEKEKEWVVSYDLKNIENGNIYNVLVFDIDANTGDIKSINKKSY